MNQNGAGVAPIELEKLDQSLSALLGSYRDALKFTARLPFLGRKGPIRYFRGEVDFTDRRWKVTWPRRKWVSRPLAQVFVEAHIQSKLKAISRHLQIELLPLKSEANPQVKRIEARIERLAQFEKSLASWRNPGTIIAKNPFLPPVIAIIVAVISRLTNIDLSSTDSLIESLFGIYQTAPLTGSELLVRAATWFLIGYSLLAPFVIHLGFRVKRVIFNGGEIIAAIFNDSLTEKWENFPTDNIYQRENQVFESIQVRKPGEFPLDFVLPILPFYWLLLSIFMTVNSFERFFQGDFQEDLMSLLVPFFVCWPGVVGFIITGTQNLRRRRSQKNI